MLPPSPPSPPLLLFSAAASTVSSPSSSSSCPPDEAKQAHDFRRWCEQQMERLTGSSDLTLIDFCMSLPRVAGDEQAKLYLHQYIGESADAMRFSTAFLAGRAQLSRAGIQAAFPLSEAVITDPSAAESSVSSGGSAVTGIGGATSRGGGYRKKKGKKGKKSVDPSLLGFSVQSNRIMMGEIQRMDE